MFEIFRETLTNNVVSFEEPGTELQVIMTKFLKSKKGSLAI